MGGTVPAGVAQTLLAHGRSLAMDDPAAGRLLIEPRSDSSR